MAIITNRLVSPPLKVAYQMKSLYLQEREKFAVYDEYGTEYMAGKAVEESEEAEEVTNAISTRC